MMLKYCDFCGTPINDINDPGDPVQIGDPECCTDWRYDACSGCVSQLCDIADRTLWKVVETDPAQNDVTR